MRIVLGIVVVLAVLGSAVAQAQSDPDPGSAQLPAMSAPDTLRTNLWLCEALMTAIVDEVATEMPSAPLRVRLAPEGDDDASELFTTMLATGLARRGYELFLPLDPVAETQPDSNGTDVVEPPPVVPDGEPTHQLSYRVNNLQLDFPADARRFGIWRQWVSRRVTVGAVVSLTDIVTGRLLVRRSLERSYQDRVADGNFEHINSNHYEFTRGEAPTGGWWHRRLEEFVVLGTLTGLVAVYFANAQ